jgi:hypothetical protein
MIMSSCQHVFPLGSTLKYPQLQSLEKGSKKRKAKKGRQKKEGKRGRRKNN